jgi:predicted RNA-binding Zn ribbon-like protein
MKKSPSGKQFIWAGNDPCLDFVNTEMVQGNQRVDLLDDFAALVAWLREAGRLSASEASEAIRRWDGTPQGDLALARARALRTVLREMVAGIAVGAPVRQAAIDEVNRLLQRHWGSPQVIRRAEGYQRVFHAEPEEPTDLLVPVAEAAAHLICERDFSRIKACGNPRCILYFYDATKNRARRWCSMATCGNRMKGAAHQQRRRSRPGA